MFIIALFIVVHSTIIPIRKLEKNILCLAIIIYGRMLQEMQIVYTKHFII